MWRRLGRVQRQVLKMVRRKLAAMEEKAEQKAHSVEELSYTGEKESGT